MVIVRLVPVALLLGAAPAPVAIEIRNVSAAPMECQVLAAHWYTPLPTVVAVPGASATIMLAFDAARGEPVDDPVRKLPLELLFCGRVGRAWETRGTLDLRALAAQAAGGKIAAGICEDAGPSLRCAAVP